MGIEPTTSGLLDQRRSRSGNQAPFSLLVWKWSKHSNRSKGQYSQVEERTLHAQD